jgi:hypothetical protein
MPETGAEPDTEVSLITKKIVAKKRVIPWGLTPKPRFSASILKKKNWDADNLSKRRFVR